MLSFLGVLFVALLGRMPKKRKPVCMGDRACVYSLGSRSLIDWDISYFEMSINLFCKFRAMSSLYIWKDGSLSMLKR